jgi:acetyl esterase/lipase
MNDPVQPIVLELWPDADAPAHEEIEFPNNDVDNRRFLRNVIVPTLTAFLPDRAISTGAAMIVCPGGGMFTLAIDYEGLDVARWLCQRGIAAFVLKYRVIPTRLDNDEFAVYFAALLQDLPRLGELVRQHTPTVLADGQQAVNMVRQRADEWGIVPDRVGMMGFSAGAYVTIITALHADRANRPNFVASIYGALWENLESPDPLPPLFIALADDDAITVEPSLQLYTAWHRAKSPVEMHIYSRGGHGFSMRNINPAAEAWIDRMYEWMQVEGLVAPSKMK